MRWLERRDVPVQEAAILHHIDAIYATVLDASRWPEALDRTAGLAGAFGAMLMVTDPVMRELEITVLSEKIGNAEDGRVDRVDMVENR